MFQAFTVCPLCLYYTGALAVEQAARQEAEAAAATASSVAREPVVQQVRVISKPRGLAGDGYCLIDEMGLTDDKLAYNAIVVRENLHFLIYF